MEEQDVSPGRDNPPDAQDFEVDSLVPVLKALADPVRLQVLLYVAASPTSVCACSVPGRFDVSQPTLSHHLKKLVEAGLVHRETRGSWAHFSIRPEGYQQVTDLLAHLSHPPRSQGDSHEC
ncbi:MAG: metalloregulator ArsR/SmtB family transcription factor [Actinomyces urogenitalis]|uniref:ArsR/SmtB family transcription factor n=1 Tax=Actinomyces urogenitalis TaxID=103621 RepID=UPI002A8186DB|nr:metalloregulator ArsR/SmtB family transcription factor [Actinomyces urogenitalis]MDY3678404.1 metalloregulator ArsR/SmtB family transcription factor [Actinomyces urogenitalis]